MSYDRAKKDMDKILGPIVDAATAAVESVRTVLEGAEPDLRGERISAIPPMVVDRVKAAKRAVCSCLDEVVDQAQERMAAALASEVQPALLFANVRSAPN